MAVTSIITTPKQAPTPAPKRAEQPRKPEASGKPSPSQPPKARENKPQPVINSQGQTTGRVLNTSA